MFFSLSLSAGLLILLYSPVTQSSVTFSFRSSFSQSRGSCTPQYLSNLTLHHLHCYFSGPSHHHLLPGLLQQAPKCFSFASFPITSHSLCSHQGDLLYIIDQILSLLCLKPSNGFTLQALLWFLSSPLPVSLVTSSTLCLPFHIPATVATFLFLEQTKLIQGPLPSYVSGRIPSPCPPDLLLVGAFHNSGLFIISLLGEVSPDQSI